MTATPDTLAALLDARAAVADGNGDDLVFLDSRLRVRERASWAELRLRAHALARALRARRETPGVALLALPPGIDFLVGLFGARYAGWTAVPASPPTSVRVAERLKSIAAALAMDVMLCREAGDNALADHPLASVALPLDTLAGATDVPAIEPGPVPDAATSTAAIVQFTSGSTRSPRGVVLHDAQVMANLDAMRSAFALPEGERHTFVTWLPPFHDMGLVGTYLHALAAGARLVMMAPTTFIARPARWLEAISEWRASYSGGPNFAWEMAAARTEDTVLATLDLSCWLRAFNGAEPVRASTLARFVERFGPAGFSPDAVLPCYGLAEATLMVSGASPGAGARVRTFARDALRDGEAVPAEDGQSLVACGSPVPGHAVTIVDDDGHAAAEGRIGEVRVEGPSVATAYAGGAADDAARFGQLADGTRTVLTGDLGFVLDGELYLTGRRSDLIVVRGENHHPHDIEYTVASAVPGATPDSACACLVHLDEDGPPELHVVQEVERGTPVATQRRVAAAIRDRVRLHHELEVSTVHLIGPRRLPRTSSGKLQRSRTARMLREGAMDVFHVSHWGNPDATGERSGATAHRSEASPSGNGDAAPAGQPAGVSGTAGTPDDAPGALPSALVALVAELAPSAGPVSPSTPLAELGLSSIERMDLLVRAEILLGVDRVDCAATRLLTLGDLAALPTDATGQDGPAPTPPSTALARTAPAAAREPTSGPSWTPAARGARLRDAACQAWHWTVLRTQFALFARATGLTDDNPHTLLRIVLAMKPYFDVTPARRVELAREWVNLEQFAGWFFHLPRVQDRVRQAEHYFPALWHSLREAVCAAPDRTLICLLHTSGWDWLLTTLMRAAVVEGRPLSLLADPNGGHQELMRNQFELYTHDTWDALTASGALALIDAHAPDLHHVMDRHARDGRLIVALPDANPTTRSGIPTVDVPLLVGTLPMATGLFVIASRLSLSLTQLVQRHGPGGPVVERHQVDAEALAGLERGMDGASVRRLIEPLLGHLESAPTAWRRWRDVPYPPAQPSARRAPDARPWDPALFVHVHAGRNTLVMHLDTQRIVRMPTRAWEVIRSAKDGPDLERGLTRLQLPRDRVLEIVDVIRGGGLLDAVL